MLCWRENLLLYIIPLILAGIGMFFRKHSLKIQGLISFPLITGCLTLFFLLCFCYIAVNAIKIKSEIIGILFGLLISLCGLIFGMLISNKILTLKFKIISLNTIGMLITILIGFLIMMMPFICFVAGFIDGHLQKLLYPFWATFIAILLGCLGCFIGAMLWSKKLKQKGDLL